MTISALTFFISVCATAPIQEDVEWTQPPIRTGSAIIEALPWASTLEEALAIAKREKKLVLATVVATSDDHWVGGYAGARQVWSRLEPPMFGEDVSSGNDDGLRKERVMMAAWFGDPDVAMLVKEHFVPVRVRCRPWDFDLDFPVDPLDPLGTRLDLVGAPALVIATPNGECLHSLGRIGVFAPEIAPAMLRAALVKAGVKDVPPAPTTRAAPLPEVLEFAAKHGIRLSEWTVGARVEFAPLATTTEIDARQRDEEWLLDRAASVLLALQSSDGGWHDPAFDVRPIGGPGTQWDYLVARTALVVDALLALRERLPARKSELHSAARRGIDVVGKFADAPEPWIWQATYALHLQVSLLGSDWNEVKPLARARAARLVQTLVGLQQDGGWTYVQAPRVHSFNTALVLCLFSKLEALGVELPDETIAKARAFLVTLRSPREPRDYWYAPSMTFEPRASSCRTALCELALLESGDKSATSRLAGAVEYFFEYEPGARSVTKIYEAYLSPNSLQDAYHYYFGHYYVARALAHLPAAQAREFAKRQLDILKHQVEADGSFVDAQAQGKSYSTAMAVLTILLDLKLTRP